MYKLIKSAEKINIFQNFSKKSSVNNNTINRTD